MHRSIIILNLNVLLLICCALAGSAGAQTSEQQPTLTMLP